MTARSSRSSMVKPPTSTASPQHLRLVEMSGFVSRALKGLITVPWNSSRLLSVFATKELRDRPGGVGRQQAKGLRCTTPGIECGLNGGFAFRLRSPSRGGRLFEPGKREKPQSRTWRWRLSDGGTKIFAINGRPRRHDRCS